METEPPDPLHRAIVAGDTGRVGVLLASDPRRVNTFLTEPRDWGEEMWLPIHVAAALGRVEAARRLLDAGASPDSRTRFRTPMHGRETAVLIAARRGHDAVLALLLERGGDAGLLDATHRGALSHAAGEGHTAVVHRLIAHGVAIDPIDDQQRTPLHWAIKSGHADAALALIDAGADVNHACPKEPAGYTPLHRCASAGGVLDAVSRRLIEAGADPTRRDPRHGKTAGELARSLGTAGFPA